MNKLSTYCYPGLESLPHHRLLSPLQESWLQLAPMTANAFVLDSGTSPQTELLLNFASLAKFLFVIKKPVYFLIPRLADILLLLMHDA